jgi:hypothetical protein
MNFLEPNFAEKEYTQQKSRAVGRLRKGPLEAVGYDNKVLRRVTNELPYQSSIEDQQFNDLRTKKYAPTEQLCNSRKLKMISRKDDD